MPTCLPLAVISALASSISWRTSVVVWSESCLTSSAIGRSSSCVRCSSLPPVLPSGSGAKPGFGPEADASELDVRGHHDRAVVREVEVGHRAGGVAGDRDEQLLAPRRHARRL